MARTEREDAIELANKVLDVPYADPDGDLCLLARQFLRVVEISQAALRNQIRYCSNGTVHISAKSFLDSFPAPHLPQ